MRFQNTYRRRDSFTLIELLVVVAILALLIAIMMPSLASARESARAARCGTTLRSLGTGLATYGSEFSGWIPSANTTGVAARIAGKAGDLNLLRSSATPLQTYDWITPVLRYETELGKNRAERFKTVLDDYGCPSQTMLRIDQPYGWSESPDKADFGTATDGIWREFPPVSYLMPIHFQLWGRQYLNYDIATWRSPAGRVYSLKADCPPEYFSAKHNGRYQSRMELLGAPARKVAGADGFRYLTSGDIADIDIIPHPNFVESGSHKFGCFSSNGAWWAGSQAYGVRNNTANWNGTVVNTTGDPEAQGRNLIWSYRHGMTTRDKITSSVHDNSGEMNALFFDGHVARLNDRMSREIEYWYPSGSKVSGGPGANGGLLDYEDGYEVP